MAAFVCMVGCRFGFDLNDDAQPDAADRPNRIFLSMAPHPGNLGGTAGADAKCQQAADDAALDGVFVALLWTSTDDVAARVVGSRGWVDLMGTPIADQPRDLNAASLFPLSVDERGQSFATLESGWWGGQPPSLGACQDWTSATTEQVLVVGTNSSFRPSAYGRCDSLNRLICAEIGHVAAVAPVVETGRIAFVTETRFQPMGAIGAADALCQAEATGAGLAGSFRAFLATATATAESRFSTAGLPWRRADGPRLTDTADELLGTAPAATWKTFLARTATGAENASLVWTGSMSDHCMGWSSTTVNGTVGSTHLTRRSQLQLGQVSCSSTLVSLLCLED